MSQENKSLTPRFLKRATYAYQIPENARAFPDNDIKSFKIRAHTLAQEIDAARAAALSGGSQVAMTAELIRRCVVEIDGHEVTNMDWLDEQSPAVREFLSLAMSLTNGAKKEDLDAFLSSQVVTSE